jgi:hypothetical protein
LNICQLPLLPAHTIPNRIRNSHSESISITYHLAETLGAIEFTPALAGGIFVVCPFSFWRNYMNISCPRCKSIRVKTLDQARSAGTVLGAASGAVSGVASAMGGAEAGAALGAIGGPVGMAVGGLAGALLGGLFGAAAGSVAGNKIGAAIDENWLENYECQHCGHSFSVQNAAS